MKKLVFILLPFIFAVALLTYSYNRAPQNTNKVLSSATANSEEKIKVAAPKSFSIPKLGIDTIVEPVGPDNDGRMGIPSNDTNVAWWKLGAKPGEIGSAVLAGHFDTSEGKPAVFYDIEKLMPGDDIIVTDVNSNIYNFKVVNKEVYSDNLFPLNKVFATSNGNYLNLITCTGDYSEEKKNYDKRLVVYAVLDL